MNNIKNKGLLLLPIALLNVGLLASCSESEAEASSVLDGEVGYYATKPRTHENVYNIKDTDIVFFEGGKSPYSFCFASKEDTDSVSFASFCNNHLAEALGIELPILYGQKTDSSKYHIVINDTEAMTEEGVPFDASLRLSNGFTITRKGNSVYVYAPGKESIQLVSLRFASSLIGYECYGNSTYSYSRNGKTVSSSDTIYLPDFSMKEIPDFDTRVAGMGISQSDRFDMGYSEITDLIPLKGTTWHNCLTVLPPTEYSVNHKEWYSADFQQVCYTAHGDEEQFKQMVSTVEKVIVEEVTKPAYKDNYRTGFFQADGAGLCSCDACRASAAYYGDGDKGLAPAHSAAMIRFINAVADLFYEDPIIKGTDRENVNLGIFAYQDSCQSPTSHLEELKVNDKVTIYIAPSRIGGSTVSWTEPLLPECGEVQRRQYENLVNWSKISNNLGFWGYSTLFTNYLLPFDTFSSMVEDARIAYDCGSTWTEFQNEFNQEGHTGFTMFKNYINSKTLIDVNLEYGDLKDQFFDNFYGAAGETMRQYFDELQEVNRDLRRTGAVTGYLGQTFSNPTRLYSFETVKHFADLIDKALSEIASLKTQSPALYETLSKNIAYEGIFPHYFLTVYYETRLNSEMTSKYRSMLVDECTRTGFKYASEDDGTNGVTLSSSLFSTWGY